MVVELELASTACVGEFFYLPKCSRWTSTLSGLKCHVSCCSGVLSDVDEKVRKLFCLMDYVSLRKNPG